MPSIVRVGARERASAVEVRSRPTSALPAIDTVVFRSELTSAIPSRAASAKRCQSNGLLKSSRESQSPSCPRNTSLLARCSGANWQNQRCCSGSSPSRFTW